jgi:hypothetical protein
MKQHSHKPVHFLLALCLLVLPLQNAWSTASMASCDMSMSSEQKISPQALTQNMEMQGCPHHVDMAMDTDVQASHSPDKSCGDEPCTNCTHATFLLPPDNMVPGNNHFTSITLFRNNLLSFLPYPDLPPPIIS